MRNKIDENFINNYIRKHNCKTILIDNYHSNRKPLKFKCECGNIFYKRFDNMQRTGYCKCRNCTNKIRGIKRRNKIDDVKKIFSDFGYNLLEEYKGCNEKVLCMDNLGFIGKISLYNVKRKKHFAILSPVFDRESTIFNSNKIALDNGYKSTVLRFLNNESLTKSWIECRCECGNIYNVKLTSFIFNKSFRCSKCSQKMSTLESTIEKYLLANNISYEKQKRFKNCRDKNPLPFDFYINDKNILIEVDGSQHYFPSNIGGNLNSEQILSIFNKTKKHDEIKNNYCIENNITLVRISYKDIKNKEYINILEKSLNLL